MSEKPCYLCGGREFKPRKGVVRDKPSLRILECVACGLVALSSTEHISAAHYERGESHVADAASAPHADMASWLRATEPDDRRRLAMFRDTIAKRRVLDFGCGAGGFLDMARDVAADVAGVELERRVHEHWKGKLKLHESLAAAGGGYDVVTAFHVVEHLPDPRAMLTELGKALKKGGRLVVEVPSSSDALLTLYDCDAFQRFSYWSEHLFLFNADTLRRVAEQAGLKVLSVEQYQRYPLSNHLYWLSRGLPGGHSKWAFLDTPEVNAAYAATLGAAAACDTLIAQLTTAA